MIAETQLCNSWDRLRLSYVLNGDPTINLAFILAPGMLLVLKPLELMRSSICVRPASIILSYVKSSFKEQLLFQFLSYWIVIITCSPFMI